MLGGGAQALRNTWDAVSLVQVADGALHETTAVLQRMRDLAVQAANRGVVDARAGSAIVWSARAAPPPARAAEPAEWLALAATGAMLAGVVGLTLAAGPVMRFTDATAAQLSDPAPYVEAVLVRQEGAR